MICASASAWLVERVLAGGLEFPRCDWSPEHVGILVFDALASALEEEADDDLETDGAEGGAQDARR